MSTTASGGKLASALRSRVADLSADTPAFHLSCNGRCKSAYLEMVRGSIIVTVMEGSNVADIRLDTNLPQYSTIRRLIDAIRRVPGYVVEETSTVVEDFPSADLRVLGLADISNNAKYTFRHRAFSDRDVSEIIDQAVALHNPIYSANTVPDSETSLVLLLAESEAHRYLASGAAKRRGLDVDVEKLLALSRSAREQYDEARRRLAKAIRPTKVREDDFGSGDAIQGHLVRRSLRAGYQAPYRDALPPTAPELFEVPSENTWDTMVRLTWSQARENTFSHYELWRSREPTIERNLNGRLSAARMGQGTGAVQTQYQVAGVAKQVFGISFGHTMTVPVFDGFFFGTAAEVPGSIMTNTTFVDGAVYTSVSNNQVSVLGEPLEPEAVYYYRLFLINYNGEVLPSNVVSVTTKRMRSRFARLDNKSIDTSNALSPARGPIAGGTPVTLKGTRFREGMKVHLGDKPLANLVIVSATEATAETPEFFNPDFVGKRLDVTISNPEGMKDIYPGAWLVDP